MTAPSWPFSSDGWGTDIDDTVELRAQTVDLWQEFPTYRLELAEFVAWVRLRNTRAPAWDARIIIGSSVQDLGWFHTEAEAKAAVEQAIGELAAET